jgi:hypothetical protein
MYELRGKRFKTFSDLYKEYEEEISVPSSTVRARLNHGWDLEDALFLRKSQRGSTQDKTAIGPHEVDGEVFGSLIDVAKAYQLTADSIYKRYARGKRGNDLVPEKKRRSYVEPAKEERNRFFVGGEGFKSEADACRHYGVKYVTYRRRKYKGLTPEQCLGIASFVDHRTINKNRNTGPRKRVKLEVGGKIYRSYAALGRDYDLPAYLVNQRITVSGYSPEEAVLSDGKTKPILVEGKRYKSMSEAARAYGKTSEFLLASLKRGLTLEQALGLQDYETLHTISWEGKTYQSRRHLAIEHGIDPDRFANRIRRGMSISKALSAGDRIYNPGRYNEALLERDKVLASSPAFLYFVSLQLNDKSLFKIGITTKTVENRLKGLGFTKIKSIKATLIECYQLEQELLGQYSDRRSDSITSAHLEGYTEVFDLSHEDVIDVKNRLDAFTPNETKSA